MKNKNHHSCVPLSRESSYSRDLSTFVTTTAAGAPMKGANSTGRTSATAVSTAAGETTGTSWTPQQQVTPATASRKATVGIPQQQY